MKKTFIGLMTATALTATPAIARDGAVYVGVEGGVLLVENIDIDVNQTGRIIAIDPDEGWEAGAFVGYDFGPVRAELEGSYKNFDINALDSSNVGVPTLNNTPVLRNFTAVGGGFEAWAGMLNALLDFGGEEGVGLAVGGGVGFASVSADDIRVNPGGPGFVDDSDTGFAWQAIAQLRAPLTNSVDVGLKYKYFNVPGVDLVDSTARDQEFDFSTHSLMGSLIFNFGGDPVPVGPPPQPIAPPPPPPLPPPPPAPPRVTCNQGPYIVFFDWDSAEITPEAATVLNSAITSYSNCGTVPIMLAGYTDRSGTVQYNLGLAARRNNSVQSYLTGRGIPAARISSEAFGEANPRVPTADGVRELQNRRVEITYGPGSGM